MNTVLITSFDCAVVLWHGAIAGIRPAMARQRQKQWQGDQNGPAAQPGHLTPAGSQGRERQGNQNSPAAQPGHLTPAGSQGRERQGDQNSPAAQPGHLTPAGSQGRERQGDQNSPAAQLGHLTPAGSQGRDVSVAIRMLITMRCQPGHLDDTFKPDVNCSADQSVDLHKPNLLLTEKYMLPT